MRLAAPLRIIAAAVVLVLILIGLVVREGAARAEGQEVLLAMTAYDPRSLLGGHYVAFQLRDSLPPGSPCPPGTAPPVGSPFPARHRWIALKKSGDRYVLAGAAATRQAALTMGDVAVRGTAGCSSEMTIDPKATNVTSPTAVDLSIGVDRFHADQQQAEALGRALSRGAVGPPAFAVVSVGADGKARLKGVIVAGRRTDLSWL
ncbi:MAG: GDYXXLXY domain-containing protein [Phenylobacterium sp.]